MVKILMQQKYFVFPIWFFILSGVVFANYFVFKSGFNTPHFVTTLLTKPEIMRESFGQSDAGSYLDAAMSLEMLAKIPPQSFWVINYWPPGMLIFEATILLLLENDEWFGVVLGFFTATSWGVYLGYVCWLLNKKLGVLAGLVALLYTLTLGPINNWILDYGIFYAEGISTLAFLAGLTLVINTISTSNSTLFIRNGVIVGILFALAAYFRTTYYSLIYSLLFASAIFFILILIKFRNELSNLKLKKSSKLLQALGFSTVSLFSMQLLVTPWLNFTQTEIRSTREWSIVGDGFIAGIWIDRDLQVDFIRDGGVGWACKIDPIQCKFVKDTQSTGIDPLSSKDLLLRGVMVAVKNPVEYASDRLRFNGLGYFTNENNRIGQPINIVYGLSNLILTFALVRSLRVRILTLWPALIIGITAYLVLFIPNLIGHIEVRYLIPFKLVILLLPVVMNLDKSLNNSKKIKEIVQ
jgi:hypothetical protein